jgi:YidC/Oxa1 family membrane protein insertase
MDRNQFIGILLIALLMLVYVTYFAPEPPQQQPQEITNTEQAASESPRTTEPISELNNLSDSAKAEIARRQFGYFSQAMEGQASTLMLENEDIKVSFNTKGGLVEDVLLKGYLTHLKEPLHLITKDNSYLDISLPASNGEIKLSQLYFTATTSSVAEGSRIVFTANLENGKAIRQTYTLAPSGFQVFYAIEFVGLQNELRGDKLALTWNTDLSRVEEDIAQNRQKSTITYFTESSGFDELKEGSTKVEEEKVSGTIKWVGSKQRFFTSAVLTESGFQNGLLRTSVDEQNDEITKTTEIQLEIPLANTSEMSFYFGPNSYKVMKKLGNDFEKNVYLGYVFVSWVNKWIIINIFYFLEKFISNYGIIIILLVLMIKLVLAPLSYKSYLSMAKMKVLKPEIDSLKEKVGGDMQKMQTEQMALYQKVGVNPLSGCIPVLLQMPILFAMFFFFPNSIELRQESFLWAHDLSTYDVFFRLPFTIPFYGAHVSLFTLLMTASTILYTWSNNQVSTVTGPMKTLSYSMPLVFMVVLNSFPAGLSFYYFVSNLVTFAQQAFIRRFVDEDKIRQILEENKLKNANKKKSKFQLRLEEAMKASQETQKKSTPKGKK